MSDSSRFATYAEFTPARPRFTTSKVRSGWRAATMRCRWSERRWSVGTIAPAACESPTTKRDERAAHHALAEEVDQEPVHQLRPLLMHEVSRVRDDLRP